MSSLRNGLVTKSNAPSLHRLDRHGNAAVGGHHDDVHVGQRALLDPLEQFDAVELGHLQVGHDDVEARRPGAACQASCAVGGGDDLVSLRGQIVGQGDALDLFVVDNEDSHDGSPGNRTQCTSRRWQMRARTRGDSAGLSARRRKCDGLPAVASHPDGALPKVGRPGGQRAILVGIALQAFQTRRSARLSTTVKVVPLPSDAADLDASAHLGDQHAAQAQAQARPARGRARRVKRLEDLLQVRPRNAHARVAHVDGHRAHLVLVARGRGRRCGG